MDPKHSGPVPGRARLTWSLAAAAVLLPAVLGPLIYLLPHGEPVPTFTSPVCRFPSSALAFDRQSLGQDPGFRPQVTNVKIVDLDGDGLQDVLACDGKMNRVF